MFYSVLLTSQRTAMATLAGLAGRTEATILEGAAHRDMALAQQTRKWMDGCVRRMRERKQNALLTTDFGVRSF